MSNNCQENVKKQKEQNGGSALFGSSGGKILDLCASGLRLLYYNEIQDFSSKMKKVGKKTGQKVGSEYTRITLIIKFWIYGEYANG